VIVGEVDGNHASDTRRNGARISAPDHKHADAPCPGGTSVPACVPAGLNPDSLAITVDGVRATDSSVNSGPNRVVSRRRAELRKEAIREK